MKTFLVTLEDGTKAIIRGQMTTACSIEGCDKPMVEMCSIKNARGHFCKEVLCGEHANKIGINKFCCPDHYLEHQKQIDLFSGRLAAV